MVAERTLIDSAPASDALFEASNQSEQDLLRAAAASANDTKYQPTQTYQFAPSTTSNSAFRELEDLLSYFRDETASAVQFDEAARDREAERLLSVYGPDLPQRIRFLQTYVEILELFARWNTDSYERADLLARFDMAGIPEALATNFKGYGRYNVQKVRSYGRSVLNDLEDDFRREGNPVHAWEALKLVRSYGLRPPLWVRDYLARGADGIMGIRDAVSSGQSAGREADRVGKALGFATDGTGRGGRFSHAVTLERNRRIYRKVKEKLAVERKLDRAYDKAAEELGMSRSMVVRGYSRIRKVIAEVRQKRAMPALMLK